MADADSDGQLEVCVALCAGALRRYGEEVVENNFGPLEAPRTGIHEI